MKILVDIISYAMKINIRLEENSFNTVSVFCFIVIYLGAISVRSSVPQI